MGNQTGKELIYMENKNLKIITIFSTLFLSGAAVAFVLTLLFAPRSGRKTRENIAEFMNKTMNKRNELLAASKVYSLAKVRDRNKNWLQKLVS